MTGVRKKGEEIRQFILENVEEYPFDIAKIVGDTFGISRQAVNRHIQQLVEKNLIKKLGTSRRSAYSLMLQECLNKKYRIEKGLAEDQVWRMDIAPLFKDLPKNVLDLWYYGFTEIFNNAIDHSGGNSILVFVHQTATYFQICISDNGEGIFKKLQRELNLLDERHAVLELAKGKLTTDPSRHSGEGIFFSSRAFDEFSILSGGVNFSHQLHREEDYILERKEDLTGTSVFMRLRKNAAHSLKSIFDQFTSSDDFSFSKTVVPVELAQYGDEALMSRSQAKRVLARIEKFKTVIFDFKGVESIGQAFADEIFRVFASSHPEIELIPSNANTDVKNMISRALAAR